MLSMTYDTHALVRHLPSRGVRREVSPGKNMVRTLGILLLAVSMAGSCLASAGLDAHSIARRELPSLGTREHQVWVSAKRDWNFANLARVRSQFSCEATRPPEALATPNPLLDAAESGHKVTVSFIIGTDGRVHSPLILESAGSSGDRAILDTVTAWRYRPAMCNGAPTDSETRIEFSRR
jgi:TonB family protein